MNSVVISGRVSALARLKVFGENEAITYIPIAVSKDWLSKEKRDEYKKAGKQTADFIKIKVTGKNAIFYSEKCYVGRIIEVKGRFETNNFDYVEDDGTKVKVKEIVVRPDKNIINFLSWPDNKNTDGHDLNGEVTPVDDDSIPF